MRALTRPKNAAVGHPAINRRRASPLEQRAADFVALDEALKRLSQFDERKSKVVEMRFFGGLNDEEIAEVLGVTTRTVLRDWKKARLWLYRELSVAAADEPAH